MTCDCGHVQGWHDPQSEGQTGMCLWPNGWPEKRECDCDAFAAATEDELPLLDDDRHPDDTPMTGEAAVQYRPAATDLPDAVVEAAAEGIGHDSDCSDVRTPSGLCTCGSVGTARAALAAASGPWAEQLDTAKAEIERLKANVIQEQEWNRKRTDDFTGTLSNTVASAEADLILVRADLAAALAQNAELERERDKARAELDRANVYVEETKAAWWELTEKDAALRAELDNLRGKCICNTGPGTDGPDETCPVHGRSYAEWIERGDQKQAELDNLRDRVTALADETGSAFPYVQVRELRAIVRGSDDE